MAGLLVTLESYELELASEVGRRRQAAAIRDKRLPRFPERYPGELWANHIQGACGELAVAKLFGWYWPGHVDTFHEPDFVVNSLRYDVRWSSNGKAKVRPDERVIVIGVAGQAPEMYVMGAISAHYARQRDDWYCADAPPCWFVPFAHLFPLDSLLRRTA
jgi:hypothetical protein